jgi:hypothetical protein
MARADVFVLESGGRIEGEWLNREEQPLTRYLVRRGKTTLTLPVGQVREAIRQSPAASEYARRSATAADTAEGQWQLAEWCRKHNLSAERQAHLRRIIELDPDHQAARGALGFQFLKGAWVTREGYRREQGYELYRGKWRTAQEIDILEDRGRTELAEKEWLGRLRRWRRDLDDREKSREAYAALAAIKDPIAAAPLGEFFAREHVRAVKTLYAQILAGLNTPAAIAILAERSLADPDEEVFYACLDQLARLHPPHVGDRFVAALKDNNNIRVNRAATALARLDDKTAISPLIDALTTTHRQVFSNGRGGDSTAATFSSSGTFVKQGDGPKLLVAHVQNQAVLDALARLSGANFGFDQKAWRYWHAQEKIARESAQPVFDTRRQ